MSRRSRIIGFGSAALLVLAGAVCTVVLPGLAQDLALGVLGLGVVLAVSLVFLEVGFSEDRERARIEAAREQASREKAAHEEAAGEEGRGEAARRRELGRRSAPPARPRLARSRGRPRRLR